jgi:hypothetical protein
MALRLILAPVTFTKSRWQYLPWWGQIIALWLAQLVLLSGIGLAAVRVSQSIGNYAPPYIALEVARDSLPGIWIQWDAGWYRSIVLYGYAANPESMAFFPLYPLTIKIVTDITGWFEELSAVMVAWVSYLAALLLMYRLARLIRDEHGFALTTILHMMLFPTAFFFLAGYAESMFVAFTILGTYLYIRKPAQAWLGSISIGLSASVRPLGWVAGIIYLVEFIRVRDFSAKPVFAFAINSLVIISGTALYFYYLYTLTGSWTTYIDAHASWQVHWQWPWLSLIRSIELIFADTLADNWFLYALNIFDFGFGLYVLTLTAVAIRWSLRGEFHWSLSLYMLITVLITFSRFGFQGPLDDMARWALILFPSYLILSTLTYRKPFLQRSTLMISAIALLFLTGWWCTGRWVG